MKLNLDTIWHDTYRNECVVKVPNAELAVFSAIHADSGPLLRLDVDTFNDAIRLTCKIDLTPDQAEKLAAELLVGAKIKRAHDAAWAAHLAAEDGRWVDITKLSDSKPVKVFVPYGEAA